MKKTAAFLLIALVSFNLFGYLLVVQFFQMKASTALELKLDHNLYDEAGLIELKIPLANPYQASQATYQRYGGEVEISGVQYKYVRRRVYQDTLYVQCIPNTPKMHLQKARDNYFALANDLTQNKAEAPGKSKITGKVLLGDYDAHSFYITQLATTRGYIKYWAVKASAGLSSSPNASPDQPPEQIC